MCLGDILRCRVLEHIEDLPTVFRVMDYWLKPSGLISHAIDFKSHGTSDKWNGHWEYSPFVWKLVTRNRQYPLNRMPHSVYLDLFKENGFKIICNLETKCTSGIKKENLASEFRHLSDKDMNTSAAFIQAIRY